MSNRKSVNLSDLFNYKELDKLLDEYKNENINQNHLLSIKHRDLQFEKDLLKEKLNEILIKQKCLYENEIKKENSKTKVENEYLHNQIEIELDNERQNYQKILNNYHRQINRNVYNNIIGKIYFIKTRISNKRK